MRRTSAAPRSVQPAGDVRPNRPLMVDLYAKD
jgi:hypothetical protein